MIELGDSPARSAAAGHAGATTTPVDAAADGSQYDDTPFPCAHPGCKVFHSDFNSGYCPLHGQGFGGGGSGGAVTRWATPSRKTSMLLQYASKAAVIVSVAAVMAVMEANDKSILLLLAYSAVGS